MGANIKVESNTAIIDGVHKLTGARVSAPDLRAGAALVIAGLAAEGLTIVDDIVYIQRGYERFEEKLRNLPLIDKNARKFSRFFLAGASTCELDKQGRILVPGTLREFAQMDKEVVLTGMLDRIEVWSKEQWLENNAYDDMDDIAQSMQELGLNI